MLNQRIFQAGLVLAMLALANVAMAAGSGTKPPKGVAASADKAKPLKIGASLPSTKVMTVDGKTVKLSKALAGQAAAIVFYRGHWCPYCVKHLKQLQGLSAQLEEQGVKLVAITPDKPEHVADTLKKAELDMTVFSDGKLDAARAMGVAFMLEEKMATRYKDALVDSTGHDTGQLPVPSVFLTNKKGKITYVHSNPDYKVRLSNEDLLAAVKSTNK